MFIMDILGSARKVLGIDSWLESTLDQKRKRTKDNILDKEALSQATQSRIALTKI